MCEVSGATCCVVVAHAGPRSWSWVAGLGLPGEQGDKSQGCAEGAEQVLKLGAERGVEARVQTTGGGAAGYRLALGAGGWEIAEGGGNGEVVEMGAHAGGGPEQEVEEGAVQEAGRGAEQDARGCEVVGVWVAGLGLPGEQGDAAKAGVQGVEQQAKLQSGCAAMGVVGGCGGGRGSCGGGAAARCAFAALRRQWAVATFSSVTEVCSRV